MKDPLRSSKQAPGGHGCSARARQKGFLCQKQMETIRNSLCRKQFFSARCSGCSGTFSPPDPPEAPAGPACMDKPQDAQPGRDTCSGLSAPAWEPGLAPC